MSDAPGAKAQELSPGRGAGLAFAVALVATLIMAAPVIKSGICGRRKCWAKAA